MLEYTFAAAPCGVEGHTIRSDGLLCERCAKHCVDDASLARIRASGEALMADDPTRPAHYKGLDPEPIRVIENWGLNFHLGNVLKYVARAGRKPGVDAVTDLRKAREYLDLGIQHLERTGGAGG